MSYSLYTKLLLVAFTLLSVGFFFSSFPPFLLVISATGVFVSACAIAADEHWKKMQDRWDD